MKKKLKQAKAFTIAFPGDDSEESASEDWNTFFGKLDQSDLVTLNGVKFEPMVDPKNVAE